MTAELSLVSSARATRETGVQAVADGLLIAWCTTNTTEIFTIAVAKLSTGDKGKHNLGGTALFAFFMLW